MPTSPHTEIELMDLFDQFTADQRQAVEIQFKRLAMAYPYKCNFDGGYTDLWLTAIAYVRDGKSPWTVAVS